MKYPIPTVLLGIALGVVIVLGGGCSKQVLSTDSTMAAQRGAEVAGATSVPEASLALQLSKEHLAEAQALYEDGKKEEAASMLLRSEADAELAIMIADASAEMDQATEAMEAVDKVRAAN
jgi:hypothetical protein